MLHQGLYFIRVVVGFDLSIKRYITLLPISISQLNSISITKYPQCRIQRSLMKQVRDEVHPKTLFATCICTVHCKCQNFFSLFKNFSHFRPEDRIFCLNIQEMINNGVAVTIPLTFTLCKFLCIMI